MTDSIIRADALTKIVKSGDDPLTILDSVSFAVEAGATIAIVGASGSGKTTLLGLLAGLDQPTSLRDVGITRDRLDEIATRALAYKPVRINPRPIKTAADVREILEIAW